MNLRPRFNERKATQVAARFLTHNGRRINYMSLIKLMYFADREALLRWGSPVTNDSYFALDRGPILSRVMNLIKEAGAKSSIWSEHVSVPKNYHVELLRDAGDDELSRAEERLIDEIYAKYGRLSQWQLVKLTHTLPEWQDPHGSSIQIDLEDILEAGGVEENERAEILRELKGLRKMQALAD
jgi:uncharacterized phage-associated protein